MIAVGIDVSKSKSTVAILNGDGSIRAKPFDVHHVADELQALVDYTSQQAIFNRRAAAREGENTEVGTRFLCLLRMFLSLMPLSLTTEKKLFCQTSAKEKRCNSKKIATLSKSCSVLSRTFLFALFFDFGNLFCRCGHNPYACIAHTVKERVKLPPLRVLLRRRFQKELVYGYIVAEHKLKENL